MKTKLCSQFCGESTYPSDIVFVRMFVATFYERSRVENNNLISNKKMIKALVFDMDGLMIDSERLYFQAEREIARQFNKKVKNETLWKMMGRSPLESVSIFVSEIGLPVDPCEVLEMRNIIMHEKLKSDLVPMPGLSHIIDRFYKRLKLAICTGAQKEFLHLVVTQLRIRKKFAVLQSSDGIKAGKPDPEIYLATCSKLGEKPQDCIVLEDSSNGVMAGNQAGCYVIAVPSSYTKHQNFSAADFMANDLFHAEKHVSHLIESNFSN